MTRPAPNDAPARPAAQQRAPAHQPMRSRMLPAAEPFRSAEEAWFWTMAGLRARRDGARSTANLGRTRRPCELDDVVKCLDELYRRRRIALVHARILRVWGERQTAPNPAYATERVDCHLWREALERLEWPLRVKGIVA